MAKGAKKQQLQSQTTTQAAPPSYAQPYVNDILSRAQNASYQPYQPYGGNRIAGFTDAEKTARTGIMGLQAPTQFKTATEMATKAGNYTPGTFDGGYEQAKFTGGDYATGQFDNTYKPTQFTGGDYATGQFGTNSFNDSGMASQYMSPYMQNVVDVQKRKAREDAQQSQLAGNLGASRQGTTGGSRQLLASLNRERNLATQMGDIQAKGSQDAYTAGMDQYRNEADRRLQAQQYGEQSRQFGSTRQLQEQQERERANQFGANFGMDAQKQREQSRQFGATQRSQAEEAAARERQFGANYKMDAAKMGEDSRQFGARQGLDAASQLGQLGTSQQTSDINRYAAMAGVGETERDLRQKDLDMKYRDFTDQRDYEKNQLRDYSDIVGAQPSGNTTESVYGKSANQTGALIGAAGNIGSAYMMNRAGMDAPYAAGGEIYSYNNGGLVALADGGGVDAGKQQGLAALAGGSDGNKYSFQISPTKLMLDAEGDPAKFAAFLQKGMDATTVAAAAALAKRVYDNQAKAMALPKTTIDGLLDPMPPQPQGQMQGQPQGQPQDQQGLAGIAPQEGQPPMGDPMQGQPPMDPMQAQGLEALAQQDQPMEEQPMEEPMMAANGGLMNINLPDDYYDEDSYAHGGIAHFDEGGTTPGVMDFMGKVATGEAPLRFAPEESGESAKVLFNWAKKNPEDAVAAGLSLPILAEGIAVAGLSLAGKAMLQRALPSLVKTAGTKVTNAARALVSKQVPGVGIGPVASRTVISPGRGLATLYGAGAIGDYFSTPKGFKEAGENLVAPTKGLPALEEQDLLARRAEGPTEQEKLMDQLYAEMRKQYEPSGGSPQAQEPEFDYDATRAIKRKELEDKYGALSPEEEAYLADLKKQKPLEDTSKQDFWRTMGDVSSKFTEGSLEGKGLVEAAAGATSVLPGSVSRSIENKKAREEKAEADNRSRRLELLNMQRRDRGDMIALDEMATSGTDSAYNRYTGDRATATTASNRAEDQKREDFYKTQENTIKMLELQLKQAIGPEKSDLQRKIDLLRTDPATYMQMFKDENTLAPKDQLAGLVALYETADDETRPAIEAQINEILNGGGGGQGYKEGDIGVTGDGRSAIYKNGRWEFSS